MPQYSAPGVYVEEVERGPKPIEGVSTSVAGFLGETERGPEEPKLVTSFADFRRVYGGPVEGSNLAHAVNGFFTNGGSRCYVGRVTAAENAGSAGLMLDRGGFGPEPDSTDDPQLRAQQRVHFPDTETTKTVEIRNLGPDSTVTVDEADVSLTGDNAGKFSATPGWSGQTDLDVGEHVTVEVTFTPASATTVQEATLELPDTADATTATIELRAREEPVVDVDAVGPGQWGERVALIVDDATLFREGENELFSLTLRYWADDDDYQLARAHEAEYEETPAPAPDVEEVYDNLSPNPESSDYYVSTVGGASNLVDLEQLRDGRPENEDGPTWLEWSAPSSPASVDVTTYEGGATEIADRTGLAAFEQVDEIAIVCAPDENNVGGLTNAVVTHCENQADRIAVLQAPSGVTDPGSISPPVDSSFAAYYYPWVTVTHPVTGNEIEVPPGGHVAGIYARSDSEVGVHKAPANETVRGVLSLPVRISKGDQETLNPKGVNCIRSFRGRGIRLWGARTTSSDPSWKYVNVRRLFLFIEESIDEGTQWVVFEPNDEELWARVRQSVSNFLTSVWEDGALMGTTPDEAFYVKCDRTTMTQNDIDNGRLICEIGIAPVKPAEFVVFRISQWTAGAEGGG